MRRAVTMFVDVGSIEVGDRWPDMLKEGLVLSRYMVGVWSPMYFQSSWCVSEWKSFPCGTIFMIFSRFVSKLDWNEALKGRALAPPPRATGRSLDDQWAARHRKVALEGLNSVPKKAFVEVYHCCVDFPIDRLQDQLLVAARQAAVHTFGWPIGLVLDKEDARPRPTNEGIIAEIKALAAHEGYDYWILTRNGDFYSLMSLFEDDRQDNAIFFDTRIVRTTEALLHCANLYRALGADSNATVQLRIGYAGLRGRRVKSAGRRLLFREYVNQYEDEVSSEVVFRLDQVEPEITHLVKSLCRPLFMLFDFFDVPDSVWDELVTSFVAGRVA